MFFADKKIKSLRFPGPIGDGYVVGKGGVTAITSEQVEGHGGYAQWLSVWAGGVLHSTWNASLHIAGVTYFEDPASEKG